MSSTGCQFIFEDPKGKRPFCKVPMSDGVSLNRAKEYGIFLQRYSGAELTRVGWSIVDFVEGEYTPDNPHTIGVYAKIFLSCNKTGERRVLFIPAPKPLIFNEKQEVKLIYGEEAAREFSILTEKSYSFRHGALWGSTV